MEDCARSCDEIDGRVGGTGYDSLIDSRTDDHHAEEKTTRSSSKDSESFKINPDNANDSNWNEETKDWPESKGPDRPESSPPPQQQQQQQHQRGSRNCFGQSASETIVSSYHSDQLSTPTIFPADITSTASFVPHPRRKQELMMMMAKGFKGEVMPKPISAISPKTSTHNKAGSRHKVGGRAGEDGEERWTETALPSGTWHNLLGVIQEEVDEDSERD